MQPATKRKLRNLSLIIIVCFILVNLGFGYPFHTRSLNSARDQNEIHSQGKSLEKYTEQDDQQLEIRRLLKIIDDLEKRKLRNKRLAIFTVHTPPYYSSWAKIAVNNHKTYADKYGYAHYVDHGKSDPRHSAWSKISSLLRHMEEDDHEWFWALDLDTLVMNGNILAEDLIDDDFDLVLNRDCNWFNAGSFLIKNSNWSRNFMKKVLNVKFPEPEFFLEQAAMMNVIDRKLEYKSHCKWLPQEQMHSYLKFPSEICDVSLLAKHPPYKPGHFVLHFPSHSNQSWFPEYIARYAKEAVGLED